MPRQLPPTFADLSELTTSSNGAVVLYGRRTDGSLVALQVDVNGVLSSSATIAGSDIQIGAIEIKDADADIRAKVKADGAGENAVVVVQNQPSAGSSNRFFEDQNGTVIGAVWTQLTFGFSCFSLMILNDDAAKVIEFSYDGTNVHGRVNVGEGFVFDFKAETGVYLRTIGAGPASYRVSAH